MQLLNKYVHNILEQQYTSYKDKKEIYWMISCHTKLLMTLIETSKNKLYEI